MRSSPSRTTGGPIRRCGGRRPLSQRDAVQRRAAGADRVLLRQLLSDYVVAAFGQVKTTARPELASPDDLRLERQGQSPEQAG